MIDGLEYVFTHCLHFSHGYLLPARRAQEICTQMEALGTGLLDLSDFDTKYKSGTSQKHFQLCPDFVNTIHV